MKSLPTDESSLWKIASVFLEDPSDLCAQIVGGSKVLFSFFFSVS